MNIFLKSFGCKVNDAEDELMLSSLIARGYTIVDDVTSSDIVLINSCAVTEIASKKVIDYIKSIKSKYSDKKIVVTGCLATDRSVDLKSFGADNIISNASKDKIVDYITTCTDSYTTFDSSKNMLSGIISTPIHKTRAFFKVQDGCDESCSYCIIPRLRGGSRSVKIEQLLADFEKLINIGYKEIVIVGIHIGLYGKEFGYTLVDLLRQMIKLDGDYRLRLSSIEVREVTDELITLMAMNSDKVAPHLHIPLQSGSDNILKLMNRKYIANDYINVVKRSKEMIANLTVGSDVIIGFPNESEIDFNNTIATIEKAGTDLLHIFPYSDRFDTVASKMDNKTDDIIKKNRMQIIKSFADNRHDNLYKNFIGKHVKVLAEHGNKGHSENYLLIYSEEEINKNIFYDMVITKYHDGRLYARPI